MTDTSSPRATALRAISSRFLASPRAASAELPSPTSAYFGINTFGARQMRDKLPAEVYAKLVASVRLGKKLDIDIAPPVAQVIKE